MSLEERLNDALFYTHNGKTVFRWCEPHVYLEDDEYISELIPEIIKVILERDQ